MLNENCDPDVRVDMAMGLDKICPETFPYIHTDEGPDDMVKLTSKSRIDADKDADGDDFSRVT